jgi:hypothetical protein
MLLEDQVSMAGEALPGAGEPLPGAAVLQLTRTHLQNR